MSKTEEEILQKDIRNVAANVCEKLLFSQNLADLFRNLNYIIDVQNPKLNVNKFGKVSLSIDITAIPSNKLKERNQNESDFRRYS